jgi:hypothetical protein
MVIDFSQRLAQRAVKDERMRRFLYSAMHNVYHIQEEIVTEMAAAMYRRDKVAFDAATTQLYSCAVDLDASMKLLEDVTHSLSEKRGVE